MDAIALLDELHGWGVPYTAVALLLGVNERTVRRWTTGDYVPDRTTTYRLHILVHLNELQPQNPSAVYVR